MGRAQCDPPLAGWAAIALIAGWYACALALLYPLADGPVVDSWLYASAVRRFMHTGEIRFAGFTQAMPIAQVLYGAAWARAFGANPVSLELSIVVLAIVCGIVFHALLMRCGARPWQAIAATGLLLFNPCFTFLSFSFMTEIPFLLLLMGAYLSFAKAEGAHRAAWLRLAALLIVIDFLIRPFAAMAIAGCAIAVLIFRYTGYGRDRGEAQDTSDRANLIAMIAPFAAAFVVCALIWIWLTVLGPKPWDLERNENHFKYLFLVSIWNYLRAGVLGPALYLGTMLAPMSILQLATSRWRRVVVIGASILAAAMVLMYLDRSLPVTPEYSCFGGWSNVLTLRGLSNRFFWDGYWQYVFLVFASLGTGGLIVAGMDIGMKLPRAALAVVIGALIYWAATIPLWFYNDRYYLVLVPAGAIVLALAPLPRSRLITSAGFAMTLAMGLMSLGGAYAYQRGLTTMLAMRDALEQQGIPRSAIDAGYSLNGQDLYRYPKQGIETMKYEAGIPMITSPSVGQYTIASGPIEGTRLVRKFSWPGPFGLGHRDLFLLKRTGAPGVDSKQAELGVHDKH